MKSISRLSGSFISIAVTCLLLFSSCKKGPNNPGYVYIPDMDVSRAYDTYSENPVFENGRTMREPVEGTISRDPLPYPFVKNDTDLVEAGETFFNPFIATPENLERGKVLFNRFCIHCHGPSGDGQGILFTSGRFLLPPGNLTQEKTRNRPDGEIYHIMTVGYGGMPAHGPQIRPDDRWKIILYVRNVIQSDTNIVAVRAKLDSINPVPSVQ